MTRQQRDWAISGLEIAPLSASLHSATLEHDFRQEVLPAHRRRAFPTVGFVALLAAALIYRDLVILGVGDEFYAALLLRAPLLAFYVVLLVVLTRVRSAQTMDHLLLVWSLVVVGATIYVHLSRPVPSPTHHAVDILMILIVSVAVPNRFLYQALPAVGLVVASLLHLWLKESTTFADAIGLWSAYIVSGLVGVMAAWQLNVAERQLYRAQREIRTLHGIVPICAECKSIRDEEGSWHQMEAYVARHTEARFSHGLCPTCYEHARRALESDARTAP